MNIRNIYIVSSALRARDLPASSALRARDLPASSALRAHDRPASSALRARDWLDSYNGSLCSFGSSVNCCFLARCFVMAEEPHGPSNVSTLRHRRANQDYSACNLFLPAEMWRKLGVDRSERNKAEELAEFLFSMLGLRLPTEPTYATMTALVCSSASPSRFELHSALQVVKSSWHGEVFPTAC